MFDTCGCDRQLLFCSDRNFLIFCIATVCHSPTRQTQHKLTILKADECLYKRQLTVTTLEHFSRQQMPWKRIGWPPLVTFVNGQVLKIIIYPSVHTALDIQVSNVTTHAVRKVILQYEWLAIYYLWYLNFFYLSAPFYDKLDNNNSSSSSGDNPNENNDPKQP